MTRTTGWASPIELWCYKTLVTLGGLCAVNCEISLAGAYVTVECGLRDRVHVEWPTVYIAQQHAGRLGRESERDSERACEMAMRRTSSRVDVDDVVVLDAQKWTFVDRCC